MLRQVIIAATVLGLTTTAWAQGANPSLPRIERAPGALEPLDTTDDIRPFSAVGRLDTGDGFCTATLIAPDLVLTAAHCLFRDRDNARRPDTDFTFNAGLRNGQVSAQRSVRASYVHPAYAYGAPVHSDRVRADLAILQLNRSIPSATVRPFPARGSAGRGDEVSVVSYGQDREAYASLETGCEVLGGEPGVHVLSCSIVQGSSGAPVLVREGTGFSIVGVVSATAHFNEDPVGLSAALDHGGFERLMSAVSATAPGLAASAMPQVRTLAGSDDGRSSLGARFLRPNSP